MQSTLKAKFPDSGVLFDLGSRPLYDPCVVVSVHTSLLRGLCVHRWLLLQRRNLKMHWQGWISTWKVKSPMDFRILPTFPCGALCF